MSNGEAEESREKLRVFISYSRSDANFADELVAGLDYDGGFDITIDRHSIEKGEDWKVRLGSLIETADTVVFVLSPASSQSEICQWEVEEATRLGKRILPVLHLPLRGINPPPHLAAINYIDFTQTPTLIAGIKDLATALRTDLEWLREGTRLLNLALDWDRADRRENRLLSGEDITEAKTWLAATPKTEMPTELHRDFIKSSEAAEVVRTDTERARLVELTEVQRQNAEAARRATRLIVVGFLASIAIGLLGIAGGWWYKFKLEEKALLAKAMRTDVKGQLVAYATQFGENSREGALGRKSPYTVAILEEFSKPRTPLIGAILQVNSKVLRTTNGFQSPFLSTDLNAELYLNEQPPTRQLKAVVVGIDNYRHIQKLANSNNDARAWAKFLVKIGFEVTLITNASKDAIRRAIKNISHTASGKQSNVNGLTKASVVLERTGVANTLSLFFFSGLGTHVNGETYLITSEAKIKRYEDLRKQAISLEEIKNTMRHGAAASLLFIDATLDNPFRRSQLGFR